MRSRSDTVAADAETFARKVTEAHARPSREILTINTPRRKWNDGRTRPEHLWIPDTQVRAGVPIEHIRWAAQYAIDKRPDVILTGNDWWDFPSLNAHEVEWADFRTRDLADDVLSGLHAWDLFIGTLRKAKDYDPLIVFVEGNHDQRFRRQYRYDVRTKRCLRGPRSFVKETPGVVWLPLEEVACIDGIHYSHYFVSNVGRPLGGTSLHKLNKLKFSYTMGHQQGLDSSLQHLANGRVLRGLVAGSFYQHDEEYRGAMGNVSHWRGLIYKHEVREGTYDLMEVSLDYLRRVYGGPVVEASGQYRADEFTVEDDDR